MLGKTSNTGNRGLSPVVGIVLLIGITIILGATAASFFVGLSDDNLETAPAAKFTFEYESSSGSDNVTIRHANGDVIPADQTYVALEGANCVGGTDDPDGEYNLADDFNLPGDEMKSGMTVQIRPHLDHDTTTSRDLCVDNGDLDLSSATVDIIWKGESGTTTVNSWDGP